MESGRRPDSRPGSTPLLKRQLRPDLNPARSPERSDLAEQGAGIVRAPEPVRIRMIQEIERLAPKLQIHSLTDREVLLEAYVPVFESRPTYNAATRVPRAHDALRHGSEAVRVEPLRHCVWRAGVRIADHVGPGTRHAIAENAQARRIHARGRYRKR